MDDHLEPANNHASSSAGVINKTNIVRVEKNTIRDLRISNTGPGELQIPITGNNALVQLSSTTTIILGTEVQKKFPFKYNIVNLEPSFYGRNKELRALKTHVCDNKKTTVISGLPGIGKTQLALKFIFDQEKAFNGNIVWINAETNDTLKQSFTDIAILLKINEVFLIKNTKHVVEKVYSYFEENSCLFIFDNAQNMEDIRDFLPLEALHSTVNYGIIITSTEKIWGSNIPVLTLCKLSLEDAVNVAKTIIGDSNCNSDEVWNTLVEFVERIPLGLQIISNLISNEIMYAAEIMETFSIKDFLKTLNAEKLLDESFPSYSGNTYTKSIYVAIKLAIEKIEKYSKDALDVLYIAAYLCPDSINSKCLSLFPFFNERKQILSKALAILSKFCLIRVHFGTITIHRLVQQTICLYQERENIQEKYINATLNILFGPLTAWKVDRVHRRFILKNKSCVQWCIDVYTRTKSPLLLYTLVEDGNKEILSKIFDKMSKDQKEYLFRDSILLQKATDRQDESIIKFLLDHGATFQQNDLTLQYALTTRNWIAAIFLIQNKCNVNTPDELGNPPLFTLIAGAGGDTSTKAILELLLSHGADIFARNCQKETLLHMCAYHQQINFLKYLCEKTEITKYINEKDIRGFTPLHTLLIDVIDGKHIIDIIEILEYLIKMGADSSIKTNKGETILHIAVTTSSFDLVEYIINHVPRIINEVDVNGSTALLKVVSNKEHFFSMEILEYLVAKGSDLTVVDNNGETVLHAAAKEFRPYVIQYLLQNEKNINVNAQDTNGYTFLHIWLNDTVYQNHSLNEHYYVSLTRFIESLKKYKFDFSLKTNKKETLLHFAVTKPHLKLLKTIFDFIKKFYDINIQDTKGRSVLHWLFNSNYKNRLITLSELKSCLEYLFQHGADVNLTNKKEQTILHLCSVVPDFQLIEFILNKNDHYKLGSIKILTKAEKIFNKINHQDINGNTALHNICGYNYAYNTTTVKCINILLDHGADIRIKNKDNETALDIAANKNTYVAVKTIIEHKNVTLDNTEVNFFDIILFKFVNDYQFSADVEQIEYFLTRDANINIKNQEQQTLLHIAAPNLNFKLIKFICDHHQYTNNINSQDEKGNTALHCLLKNKTRSNLHLLDWNNHLENVLNTIEYLVDTKGADINIKNNSQQMVLHFAAASNISNIVKCVMEKCIKSTTFNINDQDEAGNTVLHYLFNNDWLPCCKDVFDREFFAVLNYLLSNKANPTIVNKENKTPSQMARENNLSNLAGFLDEYVDNTTLQ